MRKTVAVRRPAKAEAFLVLKKNAEEVMDWLESYGFEAFQASDRIIWFHPENAPFPTWVMFGDVLVKEFREFYALESPDFAGIFYVENPEELNGVVIPNGQD